MKSFKAYIYEEEMKYIKWLVLQRQNIETGGDLFGLWISPNDAVIQLVLGPGEDCSRTTTSFHQDIKYLESIGNRLTVSTGLCNMGEWHSHHRIDLPSPSAEDQRTVWNHMDCVAGGRFLLFIANITGPETKPAVTVNCFMFNSSNELMTKGDFHYLPKSSPLRSLDYLASGSESGTSWVEFSKAPKPTENTVKDTVSLRPPVPARPVIPKNTSTINDSSFNNFDKFHDTNTVTQKPRKEKQERNSLYGTFKEERGPKENKDNHSEKPMPKKSTPNKKFPDGRNPPLRNIDNKRITKQSESECLLPVSVSPTSKSDQQSFCCCQ